MNLRWALQNLWAFFLITFPFGIRFLAFDDWSYRFGNFNPWVSGFVYVPEVVLWVVFVLFCFLNLPQPLFIKRGVLILFFVFLLNILLVSWWNGGLVLGFLLAFRIAEAGMVYALLRAEILPRRQTVFFLLAGAGVQFLIATFQFILNHSLGFTWLSEPVIAPDVLGVAKRDFSDGFKQIRSYGTFLHPNILAAYWIVVYWVGRKYFQRAPRGLGVPLHFLFFLVFILGLYFAFSRAAFLVFLTGFFLEWVLRKIQGLGARRWVTMGVAAVLVLLNVAVFVRPVETIHELSLQARMEQMHISRAMATEHPLGLGAGRFTLEMERFSPRMLAPWDFQPVHNVYALILNELGVQGLILVLAGIGYYLYRRPYTHSPVLLLLVLTLAGFDHFLFDSWAGMMLTPFVFFFDAPASSLHHSQRQ